MGLVANTESYHSIFKAGIVILGLFELIRTEHRVNGPSIVLCKDELGRNLTPLVL